MYDVIVAGAGIAGASAALFLGRHGLRVLVLDRQPLPHYKACGGGVPYAAYEPFPFSCRPIIECDVTAATFACAGDECTVELPGPVSMVMRARLDAWVLEHAGADIVAGDGVAHVVEDEGSVSVTTRSGRAYRATWLVGADGAASIVARDLGLRRGKRLGIAFEAELAVPLPVLEEYHARALFSLGCIDHGYAWIFPKAEHLSVGIGAFSHTRADLPALLQREMASRDLAVPCEGIRAHPVPLIGPLEPLHTRRAVLIGDAAGLVDPLVGEGIRYGIQAAQIAADCLAAGDPAAYTRQVQRTIGAHLRAGTWWARLFYRYPHACFRYGVRNPAVLRDLVGILDGRRSYRDLLWRTPLYLAGLVTRHRSASPSWFPQR